jgi:hypothetical protein
MNLRLKCLVPPSMANYKFGGAALDTLTVLSTVSALQLDKWSIGQLIVRKFEGP